MFALQLTMVFTSHGNEVFNQKLQFEEIRFDHENVIIDLCPILTVTD